MSELYQIDASGGGNDVFVEGTFTRRSGRKGIHVGDGDAARELALTLLRHDLPKAWADLVEGLVICAQKTDSPLPTHCERDVLSIAAEPSRFDRRDRERLKALGFNLDGDDDPDSVTSRLFGSC